MTFHTGALARLIRIILWRHGAIPIAADDGYLLKDVPPHRRHFFHEQKECNRCGSPESDAHSSAVQVSEAACSVLGTYYRRKDEAGKPL